MNGTGAVVGQRWVAFILLTVLAVVGNFFNITLFFGVDFIFGSIAALVAVRLLGTLPGILIAFLGGLETWFLWGHPYAILIFTLEAWAVGVLMRRLPGFFQQLALADLIFWIVAGAPLVLFFYAGVMGMALPQAGLIALKQPVNGIVNALLAAIILLIIDHVKRRQRVSIGKVVFNGMATSIFLTAILFSILYTGPMKGNAERSMERELSAIARIAATREAPVPLPLPPGVRLSHVSEPPADSFPVTGRLRVRLPDQRGPVMKRWNSAEYLVQHPLARPHDDARFVLVRKSAATLIDLLHKTYIQAFSILALLALLAVSLAILVTAWMVRPLENLAIHSRELPERIRRGQASDVPPSALAELNRLAENFQEMARELARGFAEITAARDHLEKRVEERTAEFRQAKEEAEVASEAKSEFISIVSHELRTPLTAMLGALKLVQGGVAGVLPDKAANMIDMTLRNGDRLQRLIQDLLDFSSMETGRMTIAPQPVDAATLIDRVIDETRGLAEGKGLKITAAVPPGLTIFADRGRIEQVLINFIGNATKFTERGSILVTARAVAGFAEISVIDTGCGISEEHLAVIFKAFTQVDGSSTRKRGGTGLGLAISERFVRLHGGRVQVESEVGRGTTFQFTVPLADGSA